MYKFFLKSFLDRLIGIIGLPFFLIVFLIVAPLIYFEDNGPVFYSGYRIGKNGKFFKMYKFRSMYVDSPDIRLKDGSTYNSKNDPRTTKIGRFLRDTSIDELPQVLNLINGTMSLIGPRPDPTDWLDKYPEDIKFFLTVKPGITGYNQAYFRNSADAEEKMKNDLFYAQNYSFIFDLKILLKTFISLFSDDNNYKDLSDEKAAEIVIDKLRR